MAFLDRMNEKPNKASLGSYLSSFDLWKRRCSNLVNLCQHAANGANPPTCFHQLLRRSAGTIP
eukprot:4290029-Amphidinium_carterae.1